ncbi:unnamed protein product, partial [Rotaria sordida]
MIRPQTPIGSCQ